MKHHIELKKQRLPLLIVLAVILFLSLIFKISLAILARNHYFLFLNGGIYYHNQSLINYLLIGSSCLFLFLILTRKWMKTVVVILCCALCLYIQIFTGGFWDAGKDYFRFESPDKQTTLIVEECSWLLAGWSNCYILVKPYLLRELDANILTDDGYTPFSNGDFKMQWESDKVWISYGFGSGREIEENGVFRDEEIIKEAEIKLK